MKLISNNMNLNFLSVVSATVLFLGCSSSENNDSDRPNDSAAESTSTNTVASSGCCFSQDTDFAPFFPAGNDMLIPASDQISTNFFCGDSDDPKKSSANKNYWIDTVQFSPKKDGKDISLKIEDHSGDPANIQAKIERKKASALESAKTNTNITVKELKTDTYTGYSWVDASKGNNASNILIEVVVDGRFYVQIMGVDHTRIELGMQLLEMIPMKDLAVKCK